MTAEQYLSIVKLILLFSTLKSDLTMIQ